MKEDLKKMLEDIMKTLNENKDIEIHVIVNNEEIPFETYKERGRLGTVVKMLSDYAEEHDEDFKSSLATVTNAFNFAVETAGAMKLETEMLNDINKILEEVGTDLDIQLKVVKKTKE